MMPDGFYNMDCLSGMKEFPDNYFDLAIVDPPYGGVTQGGYMKRGENMAVGTGRGVSKGYNLALWGQPAPKPEYYRELFRVSKNQIIWGGNYFTDNLPASQGWIVWDKENGTTDFADFEMAWTSFNRVSRMFRFRWNGMLQGDMKDKEFRIHPTQKPVRLYEWILRNYAQPGQRILDTHVGSGSSLIACHRFRCPYVGFEIDPDYYAKAKARIDAEQAQMSIFDYMER